MIGCLSISYGFGRASSNLVIVVFFDFFGVVEVSLTGFGLTYGYQMSRNDEWGVVHFDGHACSITEPPGGSHVVIGIYIQP